MKDQPKIFSVLNYSSRKWITILLTIGTTFVGIWMEKISDSVGMGSIVALALGYIGVNYAEKRLDV